MDLITSLRSMRRHWIVTLTCLVLMLAGIGGVLFKLPWTYQTTSTVVLLPSVSSSTQFGDNPYLAFNDSITATAYVLSVEVSSPQAQQHFAALGDSKDYTIALSQDTDGPVLITTVTAPSKAQASASIVAVTDALRAALVSTQANISAKNQITFQVASMDSNPSTLFSKKVKVLAPVLALGIALMMGIPLLLDYRRRRRQLKARRSPATVGRVGDDLMLDDADSAALTLYDAPGEGVRASDPVGVPANANRAAQPAAAPKPGGRAGEPARPWRSSQLRVTLNDELNDDQPTLTGGHDPI